MWVRSVRRAYPRAAPQRELRGAVVTCKLACDPGKKLIKPCKDLVSKLPTNADEAETAQNLDDLWFEAEQACEALTEAKSDFAAAIGKENLETINQRRQKIEPVLKERDEARRVTEVIVREKALMALQKKTKLKWVGPPNEADDTCVSKGLPRFHLEYTGGTFNENEFVAYADGCKHSMGNSKIGRGPVYNWYCCPGVPSWR